MKYLLYKDGAMALFSDWISHKEMQRGSADSVAGEGKAISGGFARAIWDEEKKEISVEVFGEARSLELKSNPNDSRYIKSVLKKSQLLPGGLADGSV